MNRIDHRPASPPPDGAQLQRRMLQDLERQWLDSWGAASAAQADGVRASPTPMPQPPASQGFASTGDADLSTPDRSTPAAIAPENAQSSDPAPADAAPTRPAQRQDDRHRSSEEAVSILAARPPLSGIAALATNAVATADPNVDAAVSAGACAGACAAAVTPLAVAALPVESSSAAALLVAPTPVSAAATIGGTAFAAQTTTSPPASDATTTAAPAKRAMPPAASDDLGPTRLTLRELDPDHVQATLRDAQLGHAASQLAAQGLARALMEAGYAQVRVVVNGRAGHVERTDSGSDDTAPPAASTDSFTATAPKDRIHGN